MNTDLENEARKEYGRFSRESLTLSNIGVPVDSQPLILALWKMDTIINLLQQVLENQSLQSTGNQPQGYTINVLEFGRGKQGISDASYTLLKNGEPCSYSEVFNVEYVRELLNCSVNFVNNFNCECCVAQVPGYAREYFEEILSKYHLVVG